MPPSPVLVVEDDPDLRATLARYLRRRVPVREVGSVEAAIPVLEAGRVRAVVTDIALPGRTGLSLLTEVRARWPRLPVALMSGALREYADSPALREANLVLAKPFEVHRLLQWIQGLDAEPR